MIKRVQKIEITACKDCKYYEQKTFVIPTEEQNRRISNHETKYYAYCNNKRKFIIPIRVYANFLMGGVIPFPEWCPLEIVENQVYIELQEQKEIISEE